jgi:hypothetical protein
LEAPCSIPPYLLLLYIDLLLPPFSIHCEGSNCDVH